MTGRHYLTGDLLVAIFPPEWEPEPGWTRTTLRAPVWWCHATRCGMARREVIAIIPPSVVDQRIEGEA